MVTTPHRFSKRLEQVAEWQLNIVQKQLNV